MELFLPTSPRKLQEFLKTRGEEVPFSSKQKRDGK